MRILEGHEPGSLEWRQKITATKAVAILSPVIGYRTFGTPLSVWADIKAALEGLPSVDEDNAFLQHGRIMEPLVRETLSRELGTHIRKGPGCIADPEFEWMASTPDGLADAYGEYTGDGVVELKAPSGWKRSDWEEAIPHAVLVQTMFQLRVTGLDWAVAAAYIAPRKPTDTLLFHETVWRDDGFIENCMEHLQRFWEYNVMGDHMPQAMPGEGDAKLVAAAYPEHDEETVALPDDMLLDIAREQRLGVLIPKLEKQRTGIQTKIKQHIGDSLHGVGGGVRYTWKKQTTNYEAKPARTASFRVLRSKKEAGDE